MRKVVDFATGPCDPIQSVAFEDAETVGQAAGIHMRGLKAGQPGFSAITKVSSRSHSHARTREGVDIEGHGA